MYKLLIVDDNTTHIECVKNYVNWESMGFTEIRTATNGEFALNVFKEFHPELVITDVVMPKQSGVILAENIRKINKDVHIVFMSCHEEFDYVKHAIDNEVTAYILKPIKPDILSQTVSRIVNEIEQERKNRLSEQTLNKFLPLVRESILYRILYSNNSSISDEMLKSANLSDIKNAILVVNVVMENDVNCNTLYRALDTVEKCYEDFSVNYVASLPNKFVVLIVTKNYDSEELLEEVIKKTRSHIKYLKENLGIGISAGLSDIHSSLTQASEMLIEANSAIENTFNLIPGEIYLYEDFNDADTADSQLDLHQIKNELSDILDSGNSEDISVFLEKYYPRTCAKKHYTVKAFCFTIITTMQLLFSERDADIRDLFQNSDIIWDKLNKFETIQDTYHWLTNILAACCEYMSGTEKKSKNIIVTKIKEYVNINYKDITTLRQIAQDLFISEGYARSLFKKHTGQTIFDYLIDKRIDEAKKLLVNSEYKIYEIMEMVGYESRARFIETFKRKTGLSPKDYRQKNR